MGTFTLSATLDRPWAEAVDATLRWCRAPGSRAGAWGRWWTAPGACLASPTVRDEHFARGVGMMSALILKADVRCVAE